MSRLILLIVMVTWMGAEASPPQPVHLAPEIRLSVFISGFLLIVLIPALWSRVLSRYVAIGNLHRSLARFSLGTFIARAMIPLWFAVGVFALGWGEFVERALGPIASLPIDLPGAIVGTAPAMLAWMGLWWAAFPADCALREQSIFLQLQDGLPIYTQPGFWKYFFANLRMQLLFTAVPVMLILLVRDIASLALWWGFRVNLQAAKYNAAGATDAARTIEWLLIPLSAAVVFFFAPEILRRVLQTEPLPDSSLRRRLEEMCRRTGLRYRDILLWHTGGNVGNAAVMGVLPQVRYILLSDLLIESMTERQIEAVFAHEAGHIVHRHIAWYGVFVVVAVVVQLMLGQLVDALNLQVLTYVPIWLRDPLILAVAVAMFFLMFGMLSRWFERQADVYAARTMESSDDEPPMDVASLESYRQAPSATSTDLDRIYRDEHAPTGRTDTAVGHEGATLFASALHRVAVINNIPLRARNFSHGSISDRMHYLQHLSVSPKRTVKFDRRMTALYGGLSLALAVSIAWVAVMIWRG